MDLSSETHSSNENSDSSTNFQQSQPHYSLITSLNQEEQERYKAFREAGLKRNMMKRFCFEVINQSCNPKFIIAMCGLGKVFVGELIEEAVCIQKEMNEEGPLKPSHIHEAFRRIYKNNPNVKGKIEDVWNEDFI
ncbi:transcription initiation factor TFIID [Tubulinosema ratisbonensis]|uniref:Transcription initiation factor TFIID n=1 Tax=Tubulinosema ratisbonensis TaxID=291195 RepID=A0A437AKM5_9MICR|nr:transcription initiation factor TFIID [Tubulinosema ratisbonensis]